MNSPKLCLLRWSLILILFIPVKSFSQDEKELPAVSRTYAITNANIIQAPGRKIEHGNLIIKDGLILSVGKSVAVPAEAIVIKGDSLYVYAGFIDGLSHVGVVKPKEEQSRERLKNPGNPTPERAGIMPQNDVRTFLSLSEKSIEEMRAIGFTTAQVVPYGNMLPGSGAIISLGGSSVAKMIMNANSSFYSELSGTQGAYPSTVIGVMAKWRELYRQASRSHSYETLYASNRAGLERPVIDKTLQAFYPVIDKKVPVLFKAEKTLELYRVLALQSDLGFQLTLGNVKEGWDLTDKIKTSGAQVFLSLDLPDAKKDDDKKDDKKDKKGDDKEDAAADKEKELKKEHDAKDVKKDSVNKPKTYSDLEREVLEKRKKEFLAKYTGQAAVYQKAGIKFGFSSLSAKPKDIPSNLRKFIAAGLSEEDALAALTTSPAQILGLSDRLGSIDNGKIANVIITDKPCFNEKAKIRYVFVDGEIFKQEIKEGKKSVTPAKGDILSGSWKFTTETPQGTNTNTVEFTKNGNTYNGTASGNLITQSVEAKSVDFTGGHLKFKYTVIFEGNPLEVTVDGSIKGDSFHGTSSVGEYGSFTTTGSKDPQ